MGAAEAVWPGKVSRLAGAPFIPSLICHNGWAVGSARRARSGRHVSRDFNSLVFGSIDYRKHQAQRCWVCGEAECLEACHSALRRAIADRD